MSLLLFVGDSDPRTWRRGILPGVPWAEFHDDGYYWFMWPLFEALAERTGQVIDLYGSAAFHGPALESFREILCEARALVQAQPETWQVVVPLVEGANDVTLVALEAQGEQVGSDAIVVTASP